MASVFDYGDKTAKRILMTWQKLHHAFFLLTLS
jgi:hypothetical protein